MSIPPRKPPYPAPMSNGSLLVIALIPCIPALFVAWFLFLRCGPTHYARGFTEAKFASLKEGMTADEVESVMGRPLARNPQWDGSALWTYSDRDDDTCGYERRWVHFKSGKVTAVEKMRWIE